MGNSRLIPSFFKGWQKKTSNKKLQVVLNKKPSMDLRMGKIGGVLRVGKRWRWSFLIFKFGLTKHTLGTPQKFDRFYRYLKKAGGNSDPLGPARRFRTRAKRVPRVSGVSVFFWEVEPWVETMGGSMDFWQSIFSKEWLRYMKTLEVQLRPNKPWLVFRMIHMGVS